MALEPRLMFDGALAATLAEAPHAEPAPHPVAEHPAAEPAPAVHATAAAAAADSAARAPTVTRVDLPSDATYAAGQALEFGVHMSAPTVVDTRGGTPRIAITLDDGRVVHADYAGGSGGDVLLFRHVVQQGELDADGIDVGARIDPHGARLHDAAGQAAGLELGKLDAGGVRIDAVAPYVTGVEMPASGDYRAGAALDFVVHTSEAVRFDPQEGAPHLTLLLHDGSAVDADYVDGAGGTALRFRYIVQPGVNEPVGIALGDGAGLAGASLRDGAGNLLEPARPHAAFAESQVRIDTRAPYVVEIGSGIDGPTSGQQGLRYTVRFDEAIDGLGLDDFALASTGNAHGRVASVSRLDSHTYAVFIDGVGGTGSLRLDLLAGNPRVTDRAGNALALGGTGTATQIGGVTPVILAAPGAMAAAARFAHDGAAATLDALQPARLPTIYFGDAAPARAFAPPVADTAGVLAALRALPDGVPHLVEKPAPDHAVPPPPPPIEAGRAFSVRLPGGLSGGTRVVQVAMADGRALPAWLLFDPVAGTLEGVAPRGFDGRLPLELVVRDASGVQRTLPLELVIHARDGAGTNAERPHRAPEHAVQERAAQEPPAKPALHAQFGQQRQPAGQDPALLLRRLAVARQLPATAGVHP
ncbi:hypothetical protein ASG87_12060 [Frateuria sp. Soil773]|uniref:putative Ig domain-containing protein n=1 Tax=Frateuria sp. Soil773 TaxID=1736407 RepID=UPI0006F74B8D|nr:putative Ig domain-containing protein [Frateuria sp. Soil773]KRF02191.1 hypothetical protein ASG87_12060 [Frateuria sp. Soil773]